MSTRSTSSASQRPPLDDKQKSSGWAWPRLVRAEPHKSSASPAQISIDTDTTLGANPAHSSAPASQTEGIPSPGKTPKSAPNPPTVSSPIRYDESDANTPRSVPSLEEKSRPKETPMALNHPTDSSSSQETITPDRTSTPSSPKAFQWEAAKRPQIHEPATAYKSQRTSVAEAARRLDSLDQASSPTIRRPSGPDQGFHSALPGVPQTLAQIMALPRAEKNPHSSSPEAFNEEARAPNSEQSEEALPGEAHSVVSSAHSTPKNISGAEDERHKADPSGDVTQHSNVGPDFPSQGSAGYKFNESASTLPDTGSIEAAACGPDDAAESNRSSPHDESYGPFERDPLAHSFHTETPASSSRRASVKKTLERRLSSAGTRGKPRDLELVGSPSELASSEAEAGSELPPAGKKGYVPF